MGDLVVRCRGRHSTASSREREELAERPQQESKLQSGRQAKAGVSKGRARDRGRHRRGAREADTEGGLHLFEATANNRKPQKG